VKMWFSAFCAHLNKSHGAKHAEVHAETFIGAPVSIPIRFKLSPAKFCGICGRGKNYLISAEGCHFERSKWRR
jgi:hypothetical protein